MLEGPAAHPRPGLPGETGSRAKADRQPPQPRAARGLDLLATLALDQLPPSGHRWKPWLLIVLGLGAFALMRGIRNVNPRNLVPDRTIRDLKADVNAVTEHVS